MADTMTEEMEAGPARSRPTPLGIYDRPKPESIGTIEIIALGLSIVWLLGAAIFFLALPREAVDGGSGSGALRFMMTMVSIFMPVGMIWVAATAARHAKALRLEFDRVYGYFPRLRGK